MDAEVIKNAVGSLESLLSDAKDALWQVQGEVFHQANTTPEKGSFDHPRETDRTRPRQGKSSENQNLTYPRPRRGRGQGEGGGAACILLKTYRWWRGPLTQPSLLKGAEGF